MHNPFAHHKYMLPEQHIHMHYAAASGSMPSGAQTILFLLVLFWLGVLVYYLLGRLRDSSNSHHRQTSSVPYYQPSPPPPSVRTQQRPYPYQQGYQAVRNPLAPEQPQESVHHWQEYEEPQALYPDMPPLQGD